MADLQFQPPPDWLIQNYINRQNPVAEGINSMLPALQAYTQARQQKQANKLAAGKNVIDLIAQDPELLKTPMGQSFLKDSGGSLGDYQPPTMSTGTVPSSQTEQPAAPTEQPTAGTSPTPGSPIIDHWNQSSTNQPSSNGSGQLPPTPTPDQIMRLMGRGKLGKAAVSDYKIGADTIKSIEGMGNKRIPFEDVTVTFGAANEKSIGDQLVSNAKAQGLDYVPEEKMNLALKGLGVKNAGARGGALDSMANTREVSLRQSLNTDARNTLSPMFQKGEGRNQMTILNRIGRAEPLISQMLSQKGGGDKRQIRELASSLDRIIRGGGQSAQSQIDDLIPQTARSKFANWQEWFTNDPTGTEQKAFISRYADTLKREKDVVQKQVKNMAEKNASTLRVLKQHYPEDYQAQIDSVMSNPQLVGEKAPTITNQEDYDALPSGSEYLSADGTPHRKK